MFYEDVIVVILSRLPLTEEDINKIRYALKETTKHDELLKLMFDNFNSLVYNEEYFRWYLYFDGASDDSLNVSITVQNFKMLID